MDELEISGKRFISTRFAAKQYKYHSDYIGQLIRGKKVAGQKVGRAWYADAESLAAYLKDPRASEVKKPILSVKPVEQVEPESSVVAEAPVAEDVTLVAEVVAPVATKSEMQSFRRPLQIDTSSKREVLSDTKEDVEVADVEVQKDILVEVAPVAQRDSIHIPIRRTGAKKNTGLRYVEDEASDTLPIVEEKMRAHASVDTAESDDATPMLLEEDEAAAPRVRATSPMLVPTLAILTLGALVFGVMTIGSLFVHSVTVVEAGKAASVGYSLQ